MLDVITIGESMVQLTPTRTGLLRHATRFERFVAGAASNVAVGLARLGHTTGWMSRVGEDEFGACVRAAIRGEGVDTSHVRCDDDAPTGIYFKERRQSDVTRVHYYRTESAASHLSSEDIDRDYLSKASYIHLTGILPALSDTCRDAVWKVLRIAENENLRVSFDPNFREPLWPEDEAREVFRRMLPYVYLVSAGRDEARLITGEASPEASARTLREYGPEQVVVRLGKEGALTLGSSGVFKREPTTSMKTEEPVGAGDAFNAGFLSGQLRGWDLDASLRLGNILGGFATTALGDIEGLPTRAEAQSYMTDHEA